MVFCAAIARSSASTSVSDRGPGRASGSVQPDGPGDDVVEQFVDAAEPEGGEHRRPIGRCGAEMAASELVGSERAR